MMVNKVLSLDSDKMCVTIYEVLAVGLEAFWHIIKPEERFFFGKKHKMCKEFLKFCNAEIEKRKFHSSKCPMTLEDVNANKITESVTTIDRNTR